MTGWTRAVSTLVGAAGAGGLLWLAAQIGRHTTGGYWAAYGVVAAAGLVLALSQLRGRGGNPQGTFLLAFVPVLVVAGWVLIALEPHSNWFQRHVLAWSGDIGIRHVVLDLGIWSGVLALGIGFVFGATLEPGLVGRRRAVVPDANDEAAAAENAPTATERGEVTDGPPGGPATTPEESVPR
jgi:hypothetical protein